MRASNLSASIIVAIAYTFASVAEATQLRVEPVLLELNAPAAAGALTLRNDGDVAVAVQTRIYRWSQVAGRESLDPTTDVVASPPIVTLAPHADYTVRIVRTLNQPVHGEESYRILVDQLPDARRETQSSVAIVIRQSIPIFVRAPQVSKATVSWSLTQDRDGIAVTADNAGDERLRIASLRLRDTAGSTVGFGDGLVGYVLGRSSMRFTVPKPPAGFGVRGPVLITAMSQTGTIRAEVPLQLRR
jgi:fimbrial chaperone protein